MCFNNITHYWAQISYDYFVYRFILNSGLYLACGRIGSTYCNLS